MKEIYFLNGLKNLSGLPTIVNNKKKYICKCLKADIELIVVVVHHSRQKRPFFICQIKIHKKFL